VTNAGGVHSQSPVTVTVYVPLNSVALPQGAAEAGAIPMMPEASTTAPLETPVTHRRTSIPRLDLEEGSRSLARRRFISSPFGPMMP
jgi:hypothetical protein